MVCGYILWSILRSKMNTAWVAVHNNLAILSIDKKAKIRSLKVSDRANIVKVSPLAEISFFFLNVLLQSTCYYISTFLEIL